MIRVLISDDSENKIELISKVLEEGCNLSPENIAVAKSVSEGRSKVTREYYDLILLDLVLPLLMMVILMRMAVYVLFEKLSPQEIELKCQLKL